MSGLLAGHVMNDEASQQRYQPSFTDPAAEMAEAAMRLNRTRLARQQQSATIFHPLATGYHNLWPQLAGLDPSQAAIILPSDIPQAWKHGSASRSNVGSTGTRQQALAGRNASLHCHTPAHPGPS